MKIPHALELRAAAEARGVLDETSGVVSVVVATPDGFEICLLYTSPSPRDS